jgi:hypothetical protein
MARPLLVLLLGAFGIACAAIFVRLALPAPPIVTGFGGCGAGGPRGVIPVTRRALATPPLRSTYPAW